MTHSKKIDYWTKQLLDSILGFNLQQAEKALKNGANVNALREKNDYFSTALQTAVALQNIEMVELLLVYKADIYEQDSEGRTALDYAYKRAENNVIDNNETPEKIINLLEKTARDTLPRNLNDLENFLKTLSALAAKDPAEFSIRVDRIKELMHLFIGNEHENSDLGRIFKEKMVGYQHAGANVIANDVLTRKQNNSRLKEAEKALLDMAEIQVRQSVALTAEKTNRTWIEWAQNSIGLGRKRA